MEAQYRAATKSSRRAESQRFPVGLETNGEPCRCQTARGTSFPGCHAAHVRQGTSFLYCRSSSAVVLSLVRRTSWCTEPIRGGTSFLCLATRQPAVQRVPIRWRRASKAVEGAPIQRHSCQVADGVLQAQSTATANSSRPWCDSGPDRSASPGSLSIMSRVLLRRVFSLS